MHKMINKYTLVTLSSALVDITVDVHFSIPRQPGPNNRRT